MGANFDFTRITLTFILSIEINNVQYWLCIHLFVLVLCMLRVYFFVGIRLLTVKYGKGSKCSWNGVCRLLLTCFPWIIIDAMVWTAYCWFLKYCCYCCCFVLLLVGFLLLLMLFCFLFCLFVWCVFIMTRWRGQPWYLRVHAHTATHIHEGVVLFFQRSAK